MLLRFLTALAMTTASVAGQVSFDPAPRQQINAPGTAPATGKRYTVAGQVVDAQSGAPIGHAVVRMMGQEPAQTFTGDDGHFELKDVLEGRGFLSAQRPGFQPTNQGMQQRSITVGASSSAVTLQLIPESTLRGRVVNNDGEPIEGIRVQAYRRQSLNGLIDWMPANMTNSDDAGNFLLDNLPPGVYLLHTDNHRIFNTASSIVVDGRHFPDLYPAQYFPNAADRSSAQPVQVQAGSEAQVDIKLTAVPSYSVTGSVANIENYRASCVSSEGELVSSAFHREPRTNQFVLTRLPAGTCTLQVQSLGSGDRMGGDRNESRFAELPLTIASSDLAGVTLTADEVPDIPVFISGAAATPGTPAGAPGLGMQLIPRRFNNFSPPPHMIRNQDSQAFHAALPGTYRFFGQPSGGNCLASATAGSTDLLRSFLTLTGGGSAPPIMVTLRNDCGSIKATLENPGSTTGTVGVVAVPDGAPLQAKLLMFAGKEIQLSNLTPGDYNLYVSPDLVNFPYADPEALKGIEAQKVTVGPNAQVTAQLHMTSMPAEGK